MNVRPGGVGLGLSLYAIQALQRCTVLSFSLGCRSLTTGSMPQFRRQALANAAQVPSISTRGVARRAASTEGSLASLSGLSVSELKELLAARDIDYRDCIEKRELVTRLHQAMQDGTLPRRATVADSLTPEEDRTISLFRTVSPSVVFIATTQILRESPFSMRALDVPAGTGSGFIWNRDGHIVTNFHVVQSALKGGGNIKVTLQGSTEALDATLVGAEPEKDLAVIKVAAPPGENLAPISVGSSSDLLVGQKVLAIGNRNPHSPAHHRALHFAHHGANLLCFSAAFGLDHTLTVGVVSALGREVQGAGGRPLKGCVQTDAAINPGNSGGPLLDSRGKLIGVNTAILSASGGSAGIGFAIPADTVRRIVTQLIRYGRVTKPSLGINVADDQITQGISQRLRIDLQGAVAVLGLHRTAGLTWFPLPSVPFPAHTRVALSCLYPCLACAPLARSHGS